MAAPPTTVSVGNYTVAVGETITIPVRITGGVNVYGGDVRLRYDPALVQGVSVTRGTYLSPDYVVREAIYPAPFWARYALTQINPTPPVSGDGTFMFVTLKGLKAGVSPLTLIYVELPDRYGNVMAAGTIDGTLMVVKPAFNPRGPVTR